MAGTPASLVGVTDLADWIGEPIDADSADGKRAAACLRAASALVRHESGRTWLDGDGALVTPLPELASSITLACAARVYENREAQIQGGLDDGSAAWKVEESGMYLTATEKRSLAGLRASGRLRIGTIATTRADTSLTGGYVPTDTPGVYFPW
jgi:hypothetical protein